jgi:hypothetical protein
MGQGPALPIFGPGMSMWFGIDINGKKNDFRPFISTPNLSLAPKLNATSKRRWDRALHRRFSVLACPGGLELT